MNNNFGRSSSIFPIISEPIHSVQSSSTTESESTPPRIILSKSEQWKQWKYLSPSRWSSPEICSLSSSTTLTHQDNHHKSNTDEESSVDEPSKADTNEDEKTKRKALVTICRALMLYGAPCHRIEEALEYTSEFLSVHASFIFIPGIMMMTLFDTPLEEKNELEQDYHYGMSQTVLIRCPQGFDMGKLTQVNDVIQNICTEDENSDKKISAQKSIKLLEQLFSTKPTWNPWVTLFSHMMSSLLTAPVMFNGSLLDTALSGGLGLLIGLLILLSERYTAYCNVFEISTTILVSFITKALDKWVCFTGVVLSATCILIPGYTLTMSIMELSARHVITGTIRFVYSMIYALFIGYGLEIGTSLYEAVDPKSTTSDFGVCSGSVPAWLYTALFPFMAVSIAINLGAPVRQWPSMVCCSAIGFGVSVITSKVISSYQIVGTISAFAVGIFGNLYFKVTGDLALIPLSCGIVSLVPGSVGIQGAYFMIRQDDQGSSFATQMVIASLGISVGLFAATLAVTSKERKKCSYLSY
ncbi:hypothetical protein EDC94DRAFT_531695, partial [Helicostylum pulchrum]